MLKLFLLLFALQVDARTLTQLQSDTRILARDASSSARQRFADAQITEYLNQGQREAISRSREDQGGCLQQSFKFQLTKGNTYYALPSNFLAVKRVTRGDLSLTELSPEAVDGRSRGWETATGKPTYYFLNFSSRGVIGFTPYPQTSSDTDTIKVEYFMDAPDMSASSDVPFAGVNELNEYHQILPYYAASRMTAIDGRLNLSAFYAQAYELMLKGLISNCRKRPNYLPSGTGRE